MAPGYDAITVVGVSGSPAATSRSRTLLEGALGALERYGTRARRVDLAGLSADALLARRQDPGVADALAAAQGARTAPDAVLLERVARGVAEAAVLAGLVPALES